MKKGVVLPFLLLLATVTLILGAFFVLNNNSKIPVQNSLQKPSPSPTPQIQTSNKVNTSEINTSTWKTYIDPDYGFSIKYPPYEIFGMMKPLADNIIKTVGYRGHDTEAKFVINVYKKETPQTLDDWSKARYPGETFSKTTINNQPGLKVECDDCQSSHLYIGKADLILEFEVNTNEEALDTFKFTN